MMNTKFLNYRETCPLQLLYMVSVLKELTTEVYVVGGAVRDIMIGKNPNDWDLVTDVDICELAKEFENSGFSVSMTGASHLVINVSLNGYTCEISQFRKDEVCDGRHVEVMVGDINTDAFRRDFTVNALYVHCFTNELIDPTGKGVDDIIDNLLRFVGKPKDRIKEDWLRVFRFYRFISKGFEADKKSLKAVRELWDDAYKNSTPERVRVELEKMIM